MQSPWLLAGEFEHRSGLRQAAGRGHHLDLGVCCQQFLQPEAGERFVIDKQGTIRYKQIGPFTPEAIETKLIPLVQQLKKEAANG